MSKPKPRLILVVEDHKDLREILVQLLKDEKYEVASAGNGREALDALQKGLRPTLILLDLRMPVMDGWEFLRARREFPEIAAIPVLAHSAGAPTKQPTPEDGVIGVLPKPLSVDDLCQAVEQAIAKGTV